MPWRVSALQGRHRCLADHGRGVGTLGDVRRFTPVVDGLYRRNRGTDAQTLLIVDVTIAGTLLLTQGHIPAIEAAGFLYLLTAALLLFTRREALTLIGFGVLWAVPIALFAPVGSSADTSHVVLESVGASAFAVMIAQLLLSTGRALHQAYERQREALEVQRRAVEIKNESSRW